MDEPTSLEPDAAKIARLKARFGGPPRRSSFTQLSENMVRLSAGALGVPEEMLGTATSDETHSHRTAEGAKAEQEDVKAKAAAQADVFTPDTEIGKLLSQHGAAVAEMGKELKSHPLFKAEEHDDLWRLRFLLSAKNDVSKAYENAVTCLQWREDNKIDEIAERLRTVPPDQWPGFPHVQKWTPMHVTHPKSTGGSDVYMKMGENDYDGMLGPEKSPLISEADWLLCQFYMKEWLFMRRDNVSRRTGSLAKNVIVLDMSGLTRKHVSNSRYKKLMTHPAIKKADDMYPQALGTLVIIGLPGVMTWLFNSVVKPLAPPKVQDKIQVTSDPPKVYVKLGLSIDDVPQSMGGKAEGWPPKIDARYTPP